jgi:glycosyltransferase involved in cell wall biosynthesis
VRLQFENVDFNSRSGPNNFGLKLAKQLVADGHELTNDDPEVRLAFIQSRNNFDPTVLRLDGIYFNTQQDWKEMNAPIRASYDCAKAVVVQSNFDEQLITSFFGPRENTHIIPNGTDLVSIGEIEAAQTGKERGKVWLCASSWRPHKRLLDNIRLFQQHAGPDHMMLIAGSGGSACLDALPARDDRIKVLGDLSWIQLISCMKAAGHFVHLAWLDHCPNVVIDARASGCQIYCSSTGGTSEVAGASAKVVAEADWDYQPLELYEPPPLDFERIEDNDYEDSNTDIRHTAKLYCDVLLANKAQGELEGDAK